jgi:flagellar biosynthesis protein FlhG
MVDQAQQLRNVMKMNNSAQKPLARIITVTSGKGGVGKSNIAINLACQFKKMGKKVLILDADFGLANIEIMFGTVPRHNLCDLIYQGKSISDIITWGPMEIGFISGGSGIAGMSNLGKEYSNYIIQNLSKLDSIADIIIVDTGAGISDAVLDFLVAGSEILLVSTSEPTAIADAYSLLKALNRHPRFSRDDSKIDVIANKVSSEEEGEAVYNKISTVVSRYLKLSVSYLGAVPQDKHLEESVMKQTPVSIQNPNAKSAMAFEKMAYSLMDKDYDSVVVKRGMAAFFSHIVAGNYQGKIIN